MKDVLLQIETPNGRRTITLGQELTIGRTDLSDLVLDDTGLSRKNTTIFRDDDQIMVADEDSLNGTFVNGERLTGGPRVVRNGDLIKIGSGTTITVEMETSVGADTLANILPPREVVKGSEPVSASTSADPAPSASLVSNPLVVAAVVMCVVIVFGALAAIVIATRYGGSGNDGPGKQTPRIMSSSLIPMRVIDPLGGEDEDDLDDLIASWEVEEKEIDASNVADINVSTADAEIAELNVTAAFLADRQRKSLEPRSGETGIKPTGLIVPKEFYGDGVIKQKAKLREMKDGGYRQPLDFAELAQKRLDHELIEMPMATQTFYLDVGGSADDGPFTSFSFQDGDTLIPPGTPKYQTIQRLATDFAGKQYDLNNPADRKQMRIRLLRMFNPRAKPILQELAAAYFGKFGRPLRVTSLTRSMDYQISLNKNNANSFKVRGESSLPPHTSGCAFDLARKHMTAEEQNFVMQKLAEMEDAKRLDALIEYGANACFHVFIYSDGLPPKL